MKEPDKLRNAVDYHELTKHTYENVRDSDFTLDWQQYPIKYKNYTGCEKISMPDVKRGELGINTLDAIAGLKRGSLKLDNLQGLSEFLFFIYGKTGLKRYPNMLFEMRAAPSAGALYPVEIYFASRRLNFIEDGLYHYNPGSSMLTSLRKGNLFDYIEKKCIGTIDDDVNLFLFLSTIFWRTCWKYRNRSYRYCCEDSGHLVGNILPVSNALHLEPCVHYLFNDEGINKLIGIDGEEESAMVVIALKFPPDQSSKKESIGSGEIAIPEIEPQYEPLSEKEVKYPAVKKIKGLTSFKKIPDPDALREELKEYRNAKKKDTFDPRNSVALPGPFSQTSEDLGMSIKARRSSRDYYDKELSKEDIANILYYSTFPPLSEFEDQSPVFEPSFLEVYLLVNRVENVPQGIYRYNKEKNSIHPLKLGNFIDKSTYVSLEQEIVGKSGVVIILAGNFDELEILGDRGYRTIHLEAGIIGQNIYLSATSLGLGCTGIGAFYDDDINELLDFKGTDKRVVYELIVGHPVPDERLVDR